MLNLVVIRSTQVEQSLKFYQKLGLSFTQHQHGKGLEHFASELGEVTFEIYPCPAESVPTTAIRLGFQVASVDVLVSELEKSGVEIVSRPVDSVWGRRAVVSDPDGHRVELSSARN